MLPPELPPEPELWPPIHPPPVWEGGCGGEATVVREAAECDMAVLGATHGVPLHIGPFPPAGRVACLPSSTGGVTAPLFRPASPGTRVGSPLLTKRCCPASYTIEESRLKVTARLPELLDRMVRETLVGGGAGVAAFAVSASRDGRWITDHFSPVAGSIVDATEFP
jgi:hypothetical protein